MMKTKIEFYTLCHLLVEAARKRKMELPDTLDPLNPEAKIFFRRLALGDSLGTTMSQREKILAHWYEMKHRYDGHFIGETYLLSNTW